MDDYISNRFSFIFYALFLIINYFLLVNIIIGIGFMNYKYHMQKYATNFEDN